MFDDLIAKAKANAVTTAVIAAGVMMVIQFTMFRGPMDVVASVVIFGLGYFAGRYSK